VTSETSETLLRHQKNKTIQQLSYP